MSRKKPFLVVFFAVALSLGISGCTGSNGTETPNTPTSESAEQAANAEASDEAVEESGLRSEEFTNVTLVDNDAVLITLEKFYQEKINVGRQATGKFEPVTANNIVVKVKDKTENGTQVTMTPYLNDEKLYSTYSGNNTIDAGKAVTNRYHVAKDTQPDFTELDAFDDLYNVVLNFEIKQKNADDAYPNEDTITTEVKLSDAIGGKVAPKPESENEAKSASEEQPKADVAEQPAKKAINVGDTVSNDNWEVTLQRVELTDEAFPNDTSGYYWSYEAGDGTVLLDLVYDVKVVANKAKTLNDIFGGAKVTYAGKYEYEGTEIYYDDNDGHLRGAARVAFDPLQTTQIHYLVYGIPAEAASNDESISALLLIDGQLWELNYR